MKNRCYPKYSYIIFIVLAIIMIIFSVGPLFIKTSEGSTFKIIWSSIMLFLAIICILGAFHNMQYYYFEKDSIVVKSLFGTIVRLNINKVQVYIETLPTYFSWVNSIDKKWICIYDVSSTNNILYKFKTGCSNKRKYKRIQIFFNEYNRKTIENYMHISNTIED